MGESTSRVIDGVVKVVVTVALAIAGWSLTLTIEHGDRLSRVEVGASTQSDVRDLEIKMRSEIHAMGNDIKACLNKIQRDQFCD
jgi:hypothetical protein